MAFRLSTDALALAIDHVCRYGDTDVFPHLPELAFFNDEKDALIDELRELDLDTYSPGGAIEALAAKGPLSFRIAHQLSAVDTLLFLAAVIQTGPKLEKRRIKPKADEDGIESLRNANLVELLQRELENKQWDMGRIKVLFRAIKIARPYEAIEFITDNFQRLVMFGRELCLAMQALESEEVAYRTQRLEAAQRAEPGLDVLTLPLLAARLAGGFLRAADRAVLVPLISRVLLDGGFFSAAHAVWECEYPSTLSPRLGRFSATSDRGTVARGA